MENDHVSAVRSYAYTRDQVETSYAYDRDKVEASYAYDRDQVEEYSSRTGLCQCPLGDLVWALASHEPGVFVPESTILVASEVQGWDLTSVAWALRRWCRFGILEVREDIDG